MRVLEDNFTSLVKFILKNPIGLDWETQGMGFLRLRLPGDRRLHIFHRSLIYPNVSVIHDHRQWGFHSFIVTGILQNICYSFIQQSASEPMMTHEYCSLKCGIGCEFVPNSSGTCRLIMRPRETLSAGEFYAMEPNEIHETQAIDGTTTLIKQYRQAGVDSARVFWPIGGEWISAEPRKSTKKEILLVTQSALENFE